MEIVSTVFVTTTKVTEKEAFSNDYSHDKVRVQILAYEVEDSRDHFSDFISLLSSNQTQLKNQLRIK